MTLPGFRSLVPEIARCHKSWSRLVEDLRGRAQRVAFRRVGLDGWLGIPGNLHTLSANSLNLCCLADEANIFLLPEETSCSSESDCDCKDQSLFSDPSASRLTCRNLNGKCSLKVDPKGVFVQRAALTNISRQAVPRKSETLHQRDGVFKPEKQICLMSFFFFFRRKLSTLGMMCFVLNKGSEKYH